MKTFILSGVLLFGVSSAQQVQWGQCGGNGWTGPTTCVAGSTCVFNNEWYSQCLPGSAPAPTSTPPATSTSVGGSSPTSTSLTKFAGINIAGFDFGCTTDGTCIVSESFPPLNGFGGNDGIAQMQHFSSQDGLNVFRLPTSWQYMTNNVLGGNLNAANAATYDELVQGCLATGAHCEIDIHNYARYNGAIIGQGGPTNAQFAAFWAQIAAKYADEPNIIFGVVNEPHDIPDIQTWAQTVQAVVTAIRNAGATSQMILLPGNGYTAASTFVSGGSGPALLDVKNPDGTTTNLIFDVHKYLDADNSGSTSDCVTNNIDGAFQPLATWLRANGRQAFLTETGGGNNAQCVTFVCQQNAFLNANSDVYLGYIGWAAGNFDFTYVTTETPFADGTDQLVVKECFAR